MSGSTTRRRSLTRRVIFTLAALLAYRLGAGWPVPGVDQEAFRAAAAGSDLALLRALEFLGGGAHGVLGLFLLGASPAIVASLAEQMGHKLIPSLAAIHEQPGGPERLHAIARRLTVAIAAAQATGIVLVLRREGLLDGQGPLDALACVVALTLGAVLVMWIGEQITERGIGRGLSVVMTAGILSSLAARLSAFATQPAGAQVAAALLLLASVAGVAYVGACRREVALHYPRPRLNDLAPTPRNRLVLPLNVAGITPAIFAGALLGAPASFGGLVGIDLSGLLAPGSIGFALAEAAGVLVLTFAYSGLVFDPVAQAEALRRQGAFIAGVRPGAATVAHLARLSGRLALPGGLFLAIVAALPALASTGIPASSLLVGGTSVIIVVNVVTAALKQAAAERRLAAPELVLRVPEGG